MPKYKVKVILRDEYFDEIEAANEDDAEETAISNALDSVYPDVTVELIEEAESDEEKPEPPMEGQISLFSEEADHAKP